MRRSPPGAVAASDPIAAPDRREASGYPVNLAVAALAAIPLFFVLLPVLALIFGSVSDFTSTLLSSDSHNLAVNALFPWLTISFIGGAGFVVVVAFLIFAARLDRPGR